MEFERVNRRINAFRGDVARQHGGRIEMRERGRRRRIGEVVGRNVNRLHRGDRPLGGGGDALLQRTHVGCERRLIADRRRNAAEQRRHFRARLGEPEDIVNEEEHVLTLVAEILGNREARQTNTSARPRRFVHLSIHQGTFRSLDRTLVRILVHAGLDHLMIEVVALACALTDASEHRVAAVRLGDVVDELHDQHGFSNAGAAEQADLAAFGIGSKQIHDLDAGDENLRFRGLIGVSRRVLVNRTFGLAFDRSGFINRLADHVYNTAEQPRSDRD